MNYEKIRGFKKLTEKEQKLFTAIYEKHQSGLGIEAKKDFTPISVKVEKGYFKVVFGNGEWLHYTFSGSWY